MEEKQIEYSENKKVNANVGVRRVKLSNGGIPGVFNCRFANPAVVNPNRKKKKPTTFVPPPPPQSQAEAVTTSINTLGDTKQWLGVNNNSRQLIPFWKKSVNSSVILVIQNYFINKDKRNVMNYRLSFNLYSDIHYFEVE